MLDRVSVAVLRTVVLRRYDQSSSFPCSAINSFDYVNHLLLVVEGPIDLVIVTGAQVHHDVLVPEEEHHSAGIVQLVHGVKVWHFRDIDQVDTTIVLDVICYTEQYFVHFLTYVTKVNIIICTLTHKINR